MCGFVFYIFAKACFLWSIFLQGCDERRQVGELEQILIARARDTLWGVSLTLLRAKAGGLLASQVDAALRVADLVTENGLLGPLADQLATVGDAQRSTLSLQREEIVESVYRLS